MPTRISIPTQSDVEREFGSLANYIQWLDDMIGATRASSRRAALAGMEQFDWTTTLLTGCAATQVDVLHLIRHNTRSLRGLRAAYRHYTGAIA